MSDEVIIHLALENHQIGPLITTSDIHASVIELRIVIVARANHITPG